MKQKLTYILFFVFLLPLTAFSQEEADFADPAQHEIDSLLSLVKTDTPENVKAIHYNKIAKLTSSADTTLKYSMLSLNLCKATDSVIIQQNYNFIGWSYYMLDNSEKALSYYFEAARLANKMSKKAEEASAYTGIGNCYEDLSVNDSIFYFYNKALKIYSDIKDTANIIYIYRMTGRTYLNMELYSNAEENYRKALHYAVLAKNKPEIAYCYYNIGNVTARESDTSINSAVENLKNSVSLFEETSAAGNNYYVNGKYNAYSSLANLYIKAAKLTGKKEYADSCLIYIKKLGNYYLTQGFYSDYISDRYNYVSYLVFYKKYREALSELLNLEKYITENGSTGALKFYHGYLYDIYYALGDYKNALKHFEKYDEYKFASLNDSTLNTLKNAEVERTRMIEELKRENAEKDHAAKTKRMRTFIISLIIILIAVLVTGFYIFRMLGKISSQKDIITGQWQEVDTVNSKLISSITYAKRIQRAAVSSENDVHELFPNSFVFYRPRDIVSGDFYRCGKYGRFSVMVTADCTGHGIPGAFLSMLGLSALKEYLTTEEDAANPGTILDKMREFVKTTLTSTQKGSIVDDGMDMTVCCFDFDKMEMRYAIANQTVFIIRNGENIKLKGDNMPVGRYIREKAHFQTFNIKIEKDDMVYMFSDGIQDQLGGESFKDGSQKKFLLRNLVNTLTELAGKPVDGQCEILEQTILRWRGNTPQVDDMTLVGIRV